MKKTFIFLRQNLHRLSYAAFVPLAEYKGTKLEGLYSGDLSVFLNTLFITFLFAGAALAVLRVFAAGFMNMGSDFWQNKLKVKEMIQNAIIGLLLLASAWLILYQINPNILKLDFLFPKIESGGEVAPGTVPLPSTPPSATSGNCAGNSNCVYLSGYPGRPVIKATACQGGRMNCQVDRRLAEKIVALNRTLPVDYGWEITEAWPPTVNHSNSCHQSGTCVDADFYGTATPAKINTFLQAARSVGLNPVYEVSTAGRKADLVRQGVPASYMQVVERITGEHFSLYL